MAWDRKLTISITAAVKEQSGSDAEGEGDDGGAAMPFPLARGKSSPSKIGAAASSSVSSGAGSGGGAAAGAPGGAPLAGASAAQLSTVLAKLEKLDRVDELVVKLERLLEASTSKSKAGGVLSSQRGKISA